MTVWRNGRVTAQSFDCFLESDLDIDTAKTLHIHNVSFCRNEPCTDKIDVTFEKVDMTTKRSLRRAKLVQLSIDLCRLNENACSAVRDVLIDALHTSKTLTKLTIATSTMSTAFADLLVDLFNEGNCSLVKLSLHNVQLERMSQMKDLLASLKKFSNLHSICLEKCGLETEHVLPLAALIRSQQNLSLLDISKNDFDGLDLRGLLDGGIDGHQGLRTLVLAENPIGDEGAIALSLLLSSFSRTKLESLSILDCEICDDGCRAMANGLAKFETVRELILGEEWGEYLNIMAESMRQNMVVMNIWMPRPVLMEHGNGDALTEKWWRVVQYYLHLNRASRQMLLNGRISSSRWLHTFAKENSDVDVVFSLLRERPELIDRVEKNGNNGTLVCG
ncbi:leucine rich repeat LRR-containing protein [Nitzschia inconspicua]|uniref:Leucine rich repeat LRR-containing protein n=1 Tax=Nitzschia inconspicua TaxID=303405 RepID=A0A9K3PRU8_9STRA|nr:leucine rich repeat LRR-containing protein [Nitzschia inconspicua]